MLAMVAEFFVEVDRVQTPLFEYERIYDLEHEL